jgi:hypothetical protein
VLAAAVTTAAARQSSLAPLFADTALAATLNQLPEPVRDLAGQLLALRPPLDENLSAAAVKQAFTSSGLFFETRLALASQAFAPPPSVSDDLKAALNTFRGVLASFLDTVDATPVEGSLANRTPPSVTPPTVTATAEQPSAGPPSPSAASSEPGAPQTAQRASAPLIAAAPPAVAAPAAPPESPAEPAPDAYGRTPASRPPLGQNVAAEAEPSQESTGPRPEPGLGAASLAPASGAPVDPRAARGVLRSTLARYVELDDAEPVVSDLVDAAPASFLQPLARPPAAQAAPPPPPYRGALQRRRPRSHHQLARTTRRTTWPRS